jgi:hypothetical protein
VQAVHFDRNEAETLARDIGELLDDLLTLQV